jgi:chitinase
MIAAPGSKAVIAYVFLQNRVLTPGEIAATKVTRINYAFANVRDGEIVEGFPHDAQNFAALNNLKKLNPRLQVLVSVGGWSWSGGFSDMALTPESRRKFVESAVRFLENISSMASISTGNIRAPRESETGSAWKTAITTPRSCMTYESH